MCPYSLPMEATSSVNVGFISRLYRLSAQKQHDRNFPVCPRISLFCPLTLQTPFTPGVKADLVNTVKLVNTAMSGGTLTFGLAV
uniref:Uncharacterized protein n=1 Tax=Anguilla anguilla TaxID=7936 RepID=A0A0E9X2A3_ANGAN